MLELPQEHTSNQKANGIIARYLNGNILRLVKDVIKNYEDIQEKEARKNDLAFCEEVSNYFSENYQNEKMGKIFLGLQALQFSGKRHAAHICKMCSRLSVAEKSEVLAVNRLMELPFRHLSEDDKKWLENRIHDKCPEVAELAREVYQEYGEWENVNQRFCVMRKERDITFLDAGSGRPEQMAELDGGKMAKLLWWTVHSLEIFMWPQDYALVSCK